MQHIRTLLSASAVCAPLFALALPACAQSYVSAGSYADGTAAPMPYNQSYGAAAREYDAQAREYDRTLAEFYNPRPTYDLQPLYDAPEQVVVSSDRYDDGLTTTQAHPLHGKFNFSMDGTSRVGGFTEVGPHTTWGMAVGKAAGGSTGGYYSTGP